MIRLGKTDVIGKIYSDLSATVFDDDMKIKFCQLTASLICVSLMAAVGGMTWSVCVRLESKHVGNFLWSTQTVKPVSVAARQSRQTAITPRVPSLGLFWHAVEFCAKGSPGFTGLTMWKGALFNVTYARDKPVQIFFFYHGLQRQGVPVLRSQSISSLCLLSFRANWLKACQFLKTICGRMKWEKLKWVIQKHFLNCSTGIEPKNQSNMSSSPRFLHIILRSLRLQAAHSHLSLPASLDCFCSAERKTVKRFHFTHSTTTLKVNKKEVGGSPSVFRYWHTLVVTSDLK